MSLLLLVVLFTFLEWSLRAAFLCFEGLSDLTVGGLRNGALRAVIFGPRAPLPEVRRTGASDASDDEYAEEERGVATPAPRCAVRSLVCGAGSGDRRRDDGRGLVVVVLFTVFSPTTLVEKIHFRGFLLNKFRQGAGFWRASLASSVLFGLIHVPGWPALGRFATPFVAVDFVGLVVVGMLYGWAPIKTGSLWSAHALHALHNLLVVSVVSP